jgi:hypothetical protein
MDLSKHIGGNAHGIEVFTTLWHGKTVYRVDLHHHHKFEVVDVYDQHSPGKRARFRTETKHLFFEGEVDEAVVKQAVKLLADMAAGTPNDEHHRAVDRDDIARETNGAHWVPVVLHGEDRNAFGVRKVDEHFKAQQVKP